MISVLRSLTLMVWFGCGCGLWPPAVSGDENSEQPQARVIGESGPWIVSFSKGKGSFDDAVFKPYQGRWRIVFIPLPWNGDLDEWAAKLKAGGDLVTETSHELANTLDALKIKECGILGISRAGFIAAHLAAREPRIKRVALIAPVTRLSALRGFFPRHSSINHRSPRFDSSG